MSKIMIIEPSPRPLSGVVSSLSSTAFIRKTPLLPTSTPFLLTPTPSFQTTKLPIVSPKELSSTTLLPYTILLKTTPLPTIISTRITNTTVFSNSRITTNFHQTTTKTPSKCDDYVVFSDTMRDGRGLGNQIFTVVAGLMVAQLTNRRIVMNATVLNHTGLESMFTHKYERVTLICPKTSFADRWNLAYNPDVENFILSNTSSSVNKRKSIANKTIVLGGFFQSWKYALNENHLRHVYLIMHDHLFNYTELFFDSIRPAEWAPYTYTRVGVHVRRGDVVSQHSVQFGYTTPNISYFVKAMNKMLTLFKKVQFIVASNDLAWCRDNLNSSLLSTPSQTNTYITFLKGKDVYEHFAVLSSCHHTIMSTGTFGWWAAFLNRGTTIYYKDWPRNGSTLATKFKQQDFFPPSWLGMPN